MPKYKKTGLNLLRTRYWFHSVFIVSGKNNIKQLAEFFSGKDSNTSTQWNRYKNGDTVPDTYLSIAESKLGVTEQEFVDGPMKIFSVMEELRLNDALNILTTELDAFYAERGLPVITETAEVFECYKDRIAWVLGRGKKLFDSRLLPQIGEDIIPIAFAFGHIESRMLGIEDAMKDYVIDCLSYFERKYEIPAHSWNFDIDICESIKVAVQTARLDTVFSLKTPLNELNKLPKNLKSVEDFQEQFLVTKE